MSHEPSVSRNRTNAVIQPSIQLSGTEQDFGYAMSVPSDALVLGNSLVLSVRGVYSTSALSLATTIARLKLGGTIVGQASASAAAALLGQSAQLWEIDLQLKVSAVTSTTATLVSWGLLKFVAGTGEMVQANTAVNPVTIDRSGSEVLATATGQSSGLGTGAQVQIQFFDVQIKRGV